MYSTRSVLLLVVLSVALPSRGENPVFTEILEKGLKMSDDTVVKLPSPILADGLDAAGQKAAIEAADARSSFEELVKKSYYTPVVVKVRTVKAPEGEGPAVRTVDLWFVAHGNWDVMISKDFLESAMKTKDEGKSRVVGQAGILTDEQTAARKLTITSKEGYEERFVYSTFSLFERVELSATRFSVLTHGKDSILAAGRIDPRFDKDADFPNQWRPLVRDEQAEIKPGPPHPLANAGGYAKITRLLQPADGIFIECHIAYEEAYGWFDGVNLVKQKMPVMVQEKVKTFRRKLLSASEENGEK
jgi:hypothetical protein